MTLSAARYINLLNCNLGEATIPFAAKSFEDNLVLTYLNVGENPINDGGVEKLCRGLIDKPNLTELHLESVGMTSIGAEKLAEVLKNMGKLRQLYLSNNFIGDEGLVEICKAIKGKKITHLGLKNVGMGHKGIDLVAEVIESSKKVIYYDVSSNPCGDAGLIACGKAFKNAPTKIEHFDISNTNVTSISILSFFV